MSPFDIPFRELTELPVKAAKVATKPKIPVRRGSKAAPREEPVGYVPWGTPGRTPPPTSNWKVGEYKPNLAMKQALARAHEAQPAFISLSGSPVTEKKEWAP